MASPSRPVVSPQGGPHERLDEVVRRHLASPFLRPVASHTREAFAAARPWVEAAGRPLVLDSCCGVGESTARLAARFPGHFVLGVDKSLARLGRHGGEGENYRLLRADLLDFWRLAAEAGWRPSHHFLLYPNPWPKPAHLQRRWHASPVFPALLALGGVLELRTNWETYAREHACALALAGHPAEAEAFVPDAPLTPFERKYLASGHTLWRCVVDLGG